MTLQSECDFDERRSKISYITSNRLPDSAPRCGRSHSCPLAASRIDCRDTICPHQPVLCPFRLRSGPPRRHWHLSFASLLTLKAAFCLESANRESCSVSANAHHTGRRRTDGREKRKREKWFSTLNFSFDRRGRDVDNKTTIWSSFARMRPSPQRRENFAIKTSSQLVHYLFFLLILTALLTNFFLFIFDTQGYEKKFFFFGETI